MKKIMILAVSLIVSISSFAGYKDDMMIRMEIKEKSVEKSFGGSNAEMKMLQQLFMRVGMRN